MLCDAMRCYAMLSKVGTGGKERQGKPVAGRKTITTKVQKPYPAEQRSGGQREGMEAWGQSKTRRAKLGLLGNRKKKEGRSIGWLVAHAGAREGIGAGRGEEKETKGGLVVWGSKDKRRGGMARKSYVG